MRFNIIISEEGWITLHEVIGLAVDLPNIPVGAFAVHANPFCGREVGGVREMPFAVSHVETGFRLASGHDVDDAIERATTTVLSWPEGYYGRVIAQVRPQAEIARRNASSFRMTLPVVEMPSATEGRS